MHVKSTIIWYSQEENDNIKTLVLHTQIKVGLHMADQTTYIFYLFLKEIRGELTS
jgi:hypothetical protein